MASWKDGAAYAPTTRPDGFATPKAAPLSIAPPVPPATPGPLPRPIGLQPVQAPPLDGAPHPSAARRNPSTPFAVQSATMTDVPTLPDGGRDPKAPYTIVPSQQAVLDPETAPPPPGAVPLPAPHPHHQAQGESSSKALLWLCTGMCAVGLLLPTPGPMLLTLAGVIAVLRIPEANKLAGTAVGLGAMLLSFQLLLPFTDVSLLIRLASLGITVAFVALAIRGPGPSSGNGGSGWMSQRPPTAPPRTGWGAPPDSWRN